MKKTTAGIVLAVVMCATVASSATAQTNENVNVNVNAPAVDGNTNTTSNGMAYFRAPATLLPLLLVPLAGIFYLLYEKISKRT